MAEQINALLVHANNESYNDLTRVLGLLGIRVIHAQSCKEAAIFLERKGSIDLVFTGTNLMDGGWANVLGLAQRANGYLPVIVVSRMADVALYLEALGNGAFDFVTPPFVSSDLAHIVRSAIYKELISVKQGLAAPPAA
ncbi:MAG TPA: hypothetical protein VFL79_19905 [Terriglobia bacterium]|nr:hypothetical protein [Terriglobia bacterium]